MAINTDKNSYTILFAAIMVIVVGSVLSFVASAFNDKIQKNKRLEKQQNILYAMGINENEDEGSVNFVPTNKVADEFSKYIKQQLVIEGDKVTEDNEAYLIDIKKQETAAKSGAVRKLPLFIGEKEGKKFYIIPMYGKGLWDAIWGFISLDQDLVVQGVYFDHKGETPGLGANIKERFFMDDFEGENILNDSEFIGIKVTKGNNDPTNNTKNDNKVDALAGATITGNGVSAMIKESVNLYKGYLEKIKAKK